MTSHAKFEEILMKIVKHNRVDNKFPLQHTSTIPAKTHFSIEYRNK